MSLNIWERKLDFSIHCKIVFLEFIEEHRYCIYSLALKTDACWEFVGYIWLVTIFLFASVQILL